MSDDTRDHVGQPADSVDANRHRAHDLYDDEFDDDVETPRSVRPYALTQGRTRTTRSNLSLVALVRGVTGSHDAATTPERRRIIELTGFSIQSVAEISAHLSLPLGVVRVLVSDLADAGLVVVHTGSTPAAPAATNLKVLESVLNGISSL